MPNGTTVFQELESQSFTLEVGPRPFYKVVYVVNCVKVWKSSDFMNWD